LKIVPRSHSWSPWHELAQNLGQHSPAQLHWTWHPKTIKDMNMAKQICAKIQRRYGCGICERNSVQRFKKIWMWHI
jgi:hypothetical protein